MGWIRWEDPRIPKWYQDKGVWKLLKTYGLRCGGIVDDSDKPPIIYIESARRNISFKRLYCLNCFKYTLHVIDINLIQCLRCEIITKELY